MDNLSSLQQIIAGDPVRWRLIHLVHSLGLPDCWIAAGFVRNAVWDHLHGRELSPLNTDVDMIWFDPEHCAPSHEHTAQAALQRLDPSPYSSTDDKA
ncbi:MULTISPECIES: nucleotidyltransferase family protein [Pseudomonas]|uniref:nucleotidyltransferase family protein n=1 Tax=Pseudomonas TaxID=286 RepID=UPI002658357C